jgi:hypothetical protein
MTTIACGDRVWTATGEDVKHGVVLAVGPDDLSVRFDGPFTNVPYETESVKVRDCRPGDAPRMGAESFLDYFYRCRKIIDRDDDVAKLQRDAERLGFKVVPR